MQEEAVSWDMMEKKIPTLMEMALAGHNFGVCQWLQDYQGSKESEIADVLEALAAKGDTQIVKLLISHVYDTDVIKILVVAARAGHLATVNVILAEHEKTTGESQWVSSSAIEVSIEMGHLDITHRLLETRTSLPLRFLVCATEAKQHPLPLLRMVSPLVKDPKEENSKALSVAALQSNSEIIAYLVDKCDPEEAACHLFLIAREKTRKEGEAIEEWKALDRLSVHVPMEQATRWARGYGEEHFPSWLARQRKEQALTSEPPARVRPTRRRS